MTPAHQQPNRAETPAIAGSVGSVKLLGVPVRFHFTFILLLIFLTVVGIGNRQSGLMYVVFILGLFASVLLHELGHATVAKHYGIRTVDITMFPIGGVSRLEKQPKPKEELWIALGGPFVNLVIAGALFGWLYYTGQIANVADLREPTDANLLQRIAGGNLVLCLFNLLPAFPMDGGRILRAVIARFRSEERATAIAAATGRTLAILLGLVGLLTAQFMLVFIAFFVYLGAAQEGAAVAGRSLTQGVPVRAAMITDYRTLPHGSTVRDAANLLLATSQQDFPVMHGDQVIGLLPRNSLMRALAAEGPDAYVSGFMDRDFLALGPDADLSEALPAVAARHSCVLVIDEGRLIGLLTTENLSEYLLLRRFGMDPTPMPAR